ncbi:MAG: TPM domain-containing protein, partial [Burkholderiales bacterium]
VNIKRILRHLVMTPWRVGRAFPARTLSAIEQAIKASETAHAGELRFVVEGALEGTPLFRGQSARERAIDVFSQLRIWDTEHDNGVLIYLLLADRDVEIVADRGIHSKVGSREWETICRDMETAFKQANYEGGVVAGIQAVTRHLMKHFPASGAGRNELPDKPVVL